ncbi:DUF29 family protein [Crocosphaera sp. Alani8]
MTKNLQNYLDNRFEIIYQNSVKYTKRKTELNDFSQECPYTLE